MLAAKMRVQERLRTYSVPEEVKASGVQIGPDELGSIVEGRNSEKLKAHDGVDGIGKKISTSTTNGIPTSEDKINQRKNIYGINQFAESPSKGFIVYLWEALQDTTLMILGFCAFVSLVVGILTEGWPKGAYEGLGIVASILLVVFVTATNGYRLSLQFKDLDKEKKKITVQVTRNGYRQKISIYELVVDDIVHLAVGDQVPADGRFVSGFSLLINESCVTGESEPRVVTAKNPFLLSGTIVQNGSCKMVVTTVGMRTQWGKLMARLSEGGDDETPLQVKLNRVATIIGNMVAGSRHFLCIILLLIITAITADASDGSNGSKKGSSGLTGMVIGIVIGVIVVILLFFSYMFYAKKRNQCRVRVEEHEICNYSIVVPRQATNNFGRENILGRGGSGVVYKGELYPGTKIAVKRMAAGVLFTKGLEEFEAEIAVLTKVRHRHLVALLGYCVNSNERFLVFEYMTQGTLSQRLFEFRELGTNPLSWKQRVSIALDVGRGVEYLHSLAQQSFIHRDLKPSNILLGDDMRAKVADFGLVKIGLHWDEKFSVETKLAGTFGYVAPEYANTGRLTTKADVYAFGVVLMGLVTGRKPLDMPDDRNYLVSWFCNVLISRENIQKALDQTLAAADEETLDSICKVVELARHCTARNPNQRPDMGHAVNVLGPLVEQWKPSGPEEDDGNGIDLNMSLSLLVGRWEDEGLSTVYYSFGQTQSGIANS